MGRPLRQVLGCFLVLLHSTVSSYSWPFALTLYLTSMISFSSVTAAIVGLITLAVFPAIHFLLDGYDLIFTGVLTIMALIIIFRHTEKYGANPQASRKLGTFWT